MDKTESKLYDEIKLDFYLMNIKTKNLTENEKLIKKYLKQMEKKFDELDKYIETKQRYRLNSVNKNNYEGYLRR